MAAEMEFCLLGPLQVRLSGNVVPVPAGAQRVLLATLLLRANSVVSADDLADVLWPSGPPRSARASLHNTVLRLRRSLGAEGYARVVANCGGYQIRIGAGELDVDAFESLLARARVAKAIGPDSEAAALRAALSLWRGKPLSGVSSEVLDLREVPRLEEMRLQALAARIDADVRLERYDEAIIELRQLTAAYPLREHLHALLMLALDRAAGEPRRWRSIAPPEMRSLASLAASLARSCAACSRRSWPPPDARFPTGKPSPATARYRVSCRSWPGISLAGPLSWQLWPR